MPAPVNILLVDDQPAKLLAYDAILRELGENLIKASSANEALTKLMQTEVAVILMDVCMPDMDGFELAHLIREHPRVQDTAIIFVSGVRIDDIDRLRGYRLGAVDYVSVPIVPDILRAKIRVFTELYRKTRQLAELNRELEARVIERTAALCASEERLVLALESGGGASWEWDARADRLQCTSRFAELYGFDATRAPQLRTLLASASPSDRDRLLARLDAMLATPGDDAWQDEFRMQHPTRGQLHLSRLARAFRDESGRLVRITGIDLDVTERVQREQALREMDGRKDVFIATLSHELRTPLAPLVNGLEVLCDPRTVPARRERTQAVMKRQLDQLVRLVNDLLDVSRFTSDRIKVQRAPVQLHDVVRRAIETCEPAFVARGIRLETREDDDLRVDGDLVRLVQVLTNLLNNAAKYTDEGGSVTIETSREGSDVLLRVRDTGIGMTPEILPRIFEMFSQGAADTQRSAGGLGIGLALVDRIVRLHGGTVTASSAGVGRGSELVVRLPGLDEPRVPAEAPHASTTSRVHRILVADDNVDAAMMLATLLQSRGHEVRRVHDGLDAVAVSEAFRPDVALLDIGMPRLDGYGTARWIRAQAWGDQVFLVAQTGWGQAEDRRRSAEAGFDVHLTKPVEFEDLERVLANVEPRRRHVRE